MITLKYLKGTGWKKEFMLDYVFGLLRTQFLLVQSTSFLWAYTWTAIHYGF